MNWFDSMMRHPGQVVGILAVGSFFGLVAIGMTSFWVAPQYKDAVDVALAAFKDVFLITAGVKAGLSLPKSDNDSQ